MNKKKKTKQAQNQTIKTTRKTICLDKKNICYIKANRSYAMVCCKVNGSFVASKPLAVFEKILGDNFVRCHNSILVNKTLIKGFDKTRRELLLANGEKVPVSRRNLKKTSKIYLAVKQYINP